MDISNISFETWEVGERIRQARLSSHMTIQQVCDVLDVSPQAFDKWQNGICLPTMRNMLILSKLFNTTMEDLLVGEADDRSSVVLGKDSSIQLIVNNLTTKMIRNAVCYKEGNVVH